MSLPADYAAQARRARLGVAGEAREATSQEPAREAKARRLGWQAKIGRRS